MEQTLLTVLLVLNEILIAGSAITAFSLLLYALTFNLRERVARVFALLLACVTVAYFFDLLTSTGSSPAEQELWLRLQWLGIGFVPAAYLHLSTVVVASLGKPSTAGGRYLVWLGYGLGAGMFSLAALQESLAGDLARAGEAYYLRPGPLFAVYVLFLLTGLALAGLNFQRAYKRCLTRTSRRRMVYLMAGSVGPLLGCFPFLTALGGSISGQVPHLFWGFLVLVNAGVTVLLVLIAYSVAYFGVSHPDRVVKSRLFQWIMRGPVVASTVLATTVIVNRLTSGLGLARSRLVPLALVGMLLVLQFLITLIRPAVERWLFYGSDRRDMARLHLLEERLLTTGDLRQFLESVLNAVCDVTGVRSAFVAVLSEEGLDLEVAVGPDNPLRGRSEPPPLSSSSRRQTLGQLGSVFVWDTFWLIALQQTDGSEVRGVLGLRARGEQIDFTEEEEAALRLLVQRAGSAVADRLFQKEVFQVVDRLTAQAETVQRLRAASRYGNAKAFTSPLVDIAGESDLVNWVRDALSHYWGGPNLTRSPLLRLRVVAEALDAHDGNPVNALRATLRHAIESVRPEGERRFTGEWMLYNILEMKFVEGRKVRDVAMRLAMSEADLYRKQRVAIEAVARAVAEMERHSVSVAEGWEVSQL